MSHTVKASVLALLSAVAAPVDAYWRMGCGGTLVEGRLDPIVAPNEVSSHTHVILGGNGFSPDMTYADTQASTCTSCSIAGDNSNYWVPKLYYQAQNGSFIDAPVSGGTVYYQQRVTSPFPDQYPGNVAYPAGFRMTAGNPDLRTFNASSLAQQAVSHVCLGGPPQAAPLPNAVCPDGLRSQIYFPSCWDGVNLDSPNHQSHMSYPTGEHFDSGECPTSHPVPMISIFYEFIFSTAGFDFYSPEGQDQPFVYAMGDPTGYGFHGDFFNGWDVQLLQTAIDTFTSDDAGCADNVYCGNIFQAPAISGSACTIPQLVDEQINGVLSALPGCNPVSMDPTPATDCTAPSTWGVVDSFIYTDETSEGWEYLGCGVDQYGNPALGSMPVEDSPTMTVPLCIQLCAAQGDTIAGLEYASQCFCGNTLPARASPTPGLVGDCNMPCAGNSSEWCGAGSRLSLYQKCTGTCTNAVFGPADLQSGGGGSPPPSPVPVAPASSAPAPSSAAAPVTSVAPSSAPAASPVASSSSVAVGKVVAITTSTADASDPVATTMTVVPVAGTSTSVAPESTPTGNSTVQLPAGWVSDGCWLDTVNPRSMTGITFAWYGEAITSSGCANYCNTQGYTMAGTENGGQCFCDNELHGSTQEADTDCDSPCEGDATQTCGGPARLSVFKASSSTRKMRLKHLKTHRMRARGAGDKVGMSFKA